MIATSQTLSSAAGLKVLQSGGNAIDAAVTAAAVLAVIEVRLLSKYAKAGPPTVDSAGEKPLAFSY